MTHERIAALRVVCSDCGRIVAYVGEYDLLEEEIDAHCPACFHEYVMGEVPAERKTEGGVE